MALFAAAVGGLLIAAFGSWRLFAGLYRLGQIEWRVPGHDFFDRYVPRRMRAPETIGGINDLIGGLAFIGSAVLLILHYAR